MSPEPRTDRRYFAAIAATLAMFALWGFVHRLYGAFAFDTGRVSVAQWALSFGYYLMALPACAISRNFGFKSGMVFGLGCLAVGLFFIYPAVQTHNFSFFVGAAVVMGSGLVILEVAADPLVMRLGSKETAVRRLNVAQALNPFGLLLGIAAGEWIVGSGGHSHVAAAGVSPSTVLIVLGTAVMLLAFLVDRIGFPPAAIERVTKDDSTLKSFRPLFGYRLFKLGLGAQFLYAVAQFVVWGFTARYVTAFAPGTSAATIVLWSLYGLAIGRVVGTALMFRYDPAVLLAVFAIGAAVSMAVSAVVGGQIGIWGLLAACFFLSIQFPTIFGTAVRDLEQHTKSASGLLMLSTAGGAAVLALLNVTVTGKLIQPLMILPALCCVAIAGYAVIARRADRNAA